MNLAEAVSGWQYLGQTKDGLWSKFLPIQGAEERQFKREAPPPEPAAPSLDAPIRTRLYTEILGQLGLSRVDVSDLERRGISPEEAERAGFRSVEQWQKLERPIPYPLPGLSADGRSLANYHSGYLCPVRNIDGQLVGFQIRLRQGGYRWLSSNTKNRPNGAKPNLPNGEIPLAIWRPDNAPANGIALVEGTGPKPYLVAQRLGHLVIGAAGGQWAASKETLKYSLSRAAAELKTQTILFYPDAGAVSNPHVLRQYRATWKLLRAWGYDVEICWWGQVTKADGDIDELAVDQLEWIEIISTSQFEGIVNDPRRLWKNVQVLFQKAKAQFSEFKGFGKVEHSVSPIATLDYEPGQLPTPTEYEKLGCPQIIFQKNQRLDVWREAVEKGWQYILDRSAPGLGKSHSAGVALPEAFAVEKLLFFDRNHRNPTTGTVERNYVDLPVRNAGMVLDPDRTTPLGSPHVVWPIKGQESSTSGNCLRAPLFAALRLKNIGGVESSRESPICLKCHLRDSCRKGSGNGFGFRSQRRDALKADRVRSHPDSAPQLSEFDYSTIGAFWEEASVLLNPMSQIDVGFVDIQQTFFAIRDVSPQIYQELNPLRLALLNLLESKSPRFGYDYNGIVSGLPSVPERLPEIIQVLEALSSVNLDFLDSTSEYGVQFEELPGFLKHRLQGDIEELCLEIQRRIPTNWLVPFLRAWAGLGSLRCDGKKLSIFTPSNRHAEIAQAARFNIFLDATARSEYLGLVTNINPKHILVIRQQTPLYNNLKITQIQTLGKLGKDRSETLKNRVTAIRQELIQQHDGDIVFGDWKACAQPGEAAWFVDLRGSNKFEKVGSLCTIGVPFLNIGHLQCLWHVLTGESPPLSKDVPNEKFQGFVNRLIESEITQAVGRLRSHLRSREDLNFYFMGDWDLSFLVAEFPGATLTEVKASDITLDACGFQEASLLGIFHGLKTATELDVSPTQTVLSHISGISQAQISKVAAGVGGFSRLKLIFQSLLKPYITDGIIVSAEEQFLAREFLRLVLEHEPENLIPEIAEVVRAIGKASWGRVVALLSPSIRVAAIAQLSTFLETSKSIFAEYSAIFYL